MLRPKEVVCKWVDAFNNHDVEAIVSLYHDNATNHQVTNDPVIGIDAIEAIGESQRLTADAFIEMLRAIDPTIEIDLSTYKGSHARVKAKCLRCGNEWEPVARTLIRKNPCGCSECRKRDRRMKQDAEYKAALKRSKPYITCLETYETRSTKLLHRCEICGYTWKTNPASMLKSVHGCPQWAKHPSM
jgi:rubrerythrin